jgi:hypothetical protein
MSSCGFPIGQDVCNDLTEFRRSLQCNHFFPNAVIKCICQSDVRRYLYGGQACNLGR